MKGAYYRETLVVDYNGELRKNCYLILNISSTYLILLSVLLYLYNLSYYKVDGTLIIILIINRHLHIEVKQIYY